jgi:hypothetical protein
LPATNNIFNTKIKPAPPKKKNRGNKKNRATFTYGPETRTITKLFRNSGIQVTFKTTNRKEHLKQK